MDFFDFIFPISAFQVWLIAVSNHDTNTNLTSQGKLKKMKNITKAIVKKAMVAVFAVMGVMAACAELTREDLRDDNGDVVGYKVAGLGNDEVALVFTNASKEILWTVPADIENVQFLVVGGGGAGGGASNRRHPTNGTVYKGSGGGAGGGGGGVITGYVTKFNKDEVLVINVGEGGEGASYSTRTDAGAGAVTKLATATTVYVGTTRYIEAGAGGSDTGYLTSGGVGASNSGARQGPASTVPDCNKDGASFVNSDKIQNATKYGFKGGKGNHATLCYSAGGGGGATSAGSDVGGSPYNGGNGGAGLESNITGDKVIYGAGGAGGAGYSTNGKGGAGGNGVANSGAGNGGNPNGTSSPSNGGDALANQGGGGGGAGTYGRGGNGGSGVVVFRYVEKKIKKPVAISNLVYTGDELVGVPEGFGYYFENNSNKATEVGTYTAVAKVQDGKTWADGTTDDCTIEWTISTRLPEKSLIAAEDGYIVRGLGNNQKEIAFVFTKTSDEINWAPPATLENVQFLVVGGGGGGGADNVTNERSLGGAGGGGGGVVIGSVAFKAQDEISVAVGAGGLGGAVKQNPAGETEALGASYPGEQSEFTINDQSDFYVVAYGGGRDNGATSDAKYYAGKVGGVGGSNGGNKSRISTAQEEPMKGQILGSRSNNAEAFGSKGGISSRSSEYASHGGGGARSAGDNYNGGEGLESNITGKSLVYGSGGGGGSAAGPGGIGGTGAGNGNLSRADVYGFDALPNQGGGGGGSGGGEGLAEGTKTGGNGGSGIVAFRFEYNEVASVDGYGYLDLGAAISAADAGTVTLLANAGDIELGKSIALNLNGCTVDQITLTDAAVTLTAPEKLNVVTGVKDYDVVYDDGVYSLQKVAVVQIGEMTYATFAEALAAASAMTGDVTVEIYEKVTLNQALAGSYSSIKFVGATENAEIYLDVQGYIEAPGKNVAFENLKLSKVAGGYITNAGFMNLAFGIYGATEVTYTNCTFLNGAYASSGKNTFTGCTFYRSHDRYGLWAYGAEDIVVDGCIFADFRGIKMYDEGKLGTTSLTVKNTNFEAVNNKPAIVLTSGKSVTLEKNTYSSTGVFELDLDGVPNGTLVTSDVPPTCINDNGACGVLVDGKIYTTVAQAAEVADASSTVTLLHNSAETVVLPIGVTLNKNNFEAAGITVAQPVAKIGDTPYATLQKAVDAAQNGDTVTVLADVSDVIVEVAKNITISGSVTMNNVGINAVGATEMTVGGLSFAGNSWINCGTATKLTVSGVTANVTPSNTAYTNSRSAFISLGRSEQHSLELVVENCNIVSKGGSDPILGWAAIVKATITGSVFGSESAYQSNSDSIKFMGIADGAEFAIRNNKFYSNYNGIVFGQNVTRDNSYSVVLDGNEFFGGADHIWIEITGGDTVHAKVKATSDNTVNGNKFTATDIKYRYGVIKNWDGYAGVDVVTDADGKVIGGTLAYYDEDFVAEGYVVGSNGSVAQDPLYGKVAKIGDVGYATLSAAFAAVTDDSQTVTILKDVTENLTGAYLRGNITTENDAKVTITLTNSDWVYCPYTFVIGKDVTLKTPALFYYAGGAIIKGTVITDAYYQRYAGTKLYIEGTMTVNSETFILRYTDGDANAGIYVNGGTLNASVIYFYQGMISATNGGKINVGTYWQTNETDGQGSANLVLDNSTLTVSVYDHSAKATGNSTVTLKNGSTMNCQNGGFTYGETALLTVDSTSSIIGKGGEVVKIPVAKIAGNGYTSLEDAFAAAKEGETIVMLADATPALTSQRAITKAATIDLGGKTLTLTEDDLYFGTTTFKNGTIVVDPSVKPSTAVFWMFANQTLTFDNVKLVATGVTGTYLIGLDGNNADLNVLNGSEIVVENTTALDLDIICVNASTGNDIVINNSKVKVTNLDGRVFFRGNYTISGTSDIDLSGITKAGFRIEAGQTLTIADTATVDIVGEPRDGGIHLTDYTSTYTKADAATVNATVNKPAVVKIGETDYDTIAEALAAAKSGDTIELLTDVTVEGTAQLPAGITIKSNGKKINGSIRMLGDLTLDGPLTITGGLWVGKSGETLTATLSGGKLTASYFMFQCGTYTINADIDAVYGYLSYNGTFEVNSTIHTTGTNGEVLYINGNVTLNNGAVLDSDNSVFVNNNNAVLTLKPGSKVDSNVSITKSGAKVYVDATGMTAGAFANITGTVTNSGNGTVAVVNSNMFVAQIVDGKIVLVGYVAKIGEQKYTSLQSAVDVAVEGDMITLLSDVEQEDGVVITDKKLTVNLNGKTFTVSNGASTNNRNFKINGSSEVTITNGTLVAKGELTSGAYGTVRTEDAAVANLIGLKLYSYRGYGLNVKACTGTIINIKDTEIYAQYSGGVESAGGTINLTNVKIEQTGVYSGAAWCSVAIGVNGGGKVVVNSGTYSAKTIASDANAAQGTWVAYVMSSGGTLEINDGTFNGVVAETATAANACGIICADTKAVVEINGGTFNSNGAILDMRNNTGATPNPTATLKGGTYSADPRVSGLYASNLIKVAEGYVVTANNGVWTVAKAIAKIGEDSYTDLVDAFKAATSGCTIEILSDVTVDYKWDCRDYVTGGSHSQFKESVTINGNGHTLKFTGTISDGNWMTIFRFEEKATVNNLTVDISEATGAQRVISAKKSLTVDGLTIIGSAKYGIIYGEGASAADLAATEIVVKNSTLTGTRRAISDNEGAKDVKSVVITGNNLKANAYASASESITFNNNTAAGEVDLRSYTAENVLSVEAKGNTLTEGVKNYIYAKNIDAQADFTAERVPTTVSTYEQLIAALAEDNAYVVLANDITATATQSSDYGKAGIVVEAGDVLDGAGHKLTINGAGGTWDCVIAMKGGEVRNLTIAGAMRGVFMPGANGDVVIDNCVFKDVVYTFNSDAGSKDYTVTIKNTTLNGWTSFSDAHKSVTFENCSFGEGSGYAFCRPYQATTFIGCSFAEGFKFDAHNPASNTLAFNDCTYAGQPLDSENGEALFFNGGQVLVGGNSIDFGAVAKIGDVRYATIQDAFKAATADVTITLLDNVTVSEAWDNRYTGAKFMVPVTIDGNGKTIKFTNTVYDGGNYLSAFRFEADATVKNLTIDMSDAKSGFAGRFRAISAKADLIVTGCTFIGNGSENNTRAIIFGEGAGDAIAEQDVIVTNSRFIGWKRGVSDNENAQDAKSVVLTGNEFENADVYLSASGNIKFNGNKMENGYVNITSYTVGNDLDVEATGNTLAANGALNYNSINAGGTVTQEGFLTPVAEIAGKKYYIIETAFAAAKEGDEVVLLADVAPALTSQRAITKASVIDLSGKTMTLNKGDLYFGTTAFKNGNIVVDPSVVSSTAVFWMFENQVLTFEEVKLTATGVTGTYLIGINGGSKTVVNLVESEIVIDNGSTASLTAVICDNGTGNTVVIEKSTINVKNLDGRFYLGGKNGSVTVTDSDIALNGVKEGFYLRANQTMTVDGASNVNVTLNSDEDRWGINVTDLSATYVKADTATVNATMNYFNGAGTETNPFQIASLDDLVLLRDRVNAGQPCAGKYFVQTADIDLDGINWMPIGSVTQEHGFMGNFDGNGFKIKNLTISSPTLDSDGYAYAGFFSVTEGTDANNQNIIKNLTIENVTIDTTGHIVSAAIAYPYYTIVDNVKVCGDINITGGNYTAGALAYTRRCVNASNVSVVGNDGSTITGAQTVGGVISDIQMNGGLTAVYSNFSAENLTITGTKQVGGIAGIIATQTLNGATVKNVTIVCSDTNRVGQVAGAFGGTSTISNIVVEKVTGATAVIGGAYDGGAAVQAKVGDTFYATFAEAFAAAKSGDTLSLLADIEASEVILLDKNLTINGNGHKVTSSATRVFRVTTADTEVTLNDVNMVSTAVRVGTNDIRGISVDDVANVKLTLNNCSVDFIDASANDWTYAVNVTGGSNHTLTVNGGTYEGANVINVRGANNKVVVKNAMLNSIYPDSDMYYGAGIWVLQNNGSSVEATGNTFNGTNALAFNLGTGTSLTASNNTDNTSVCAAFAVAKIGDKGYMTLASAIAVVKNGETIVLAKDCNENVTISQKVGVSFAIDGDNKTYTGTINIHGNSRFSDETLTIMNFDFFTTEAEHDFIWSDSQDAPARYPHNVTVSNSEFMAMGNGENSAVGIRLRQGKNINVVDCSATGLHSLIQAKSCSGAGVNVDGVTMMNCKNGMSFGTSNFSVANSWIYTTGADSYGIRADGSGAYMATVEDCVINAYIPVLVRNTADDGFTLTVAGDNHFMADNGLMENGESYLVVFSKGDVDAEKSPVAPETTFNLVIEDGSLDPSKVYPGFEALVGTKYFGQLEDAVAAAQDGDTVTVLKNVGTDAAIVVNKVITIDLNGKTIAATQNDTVGDGVFCVIASGELTINDSVGTGVINGVGDNNYNMAIWANGGKVTINGGNFTNVGATDKNDPNAHFDLIYVKNGGEVVINGGHFECQTPAFTLNSHDTNKGTITVNGGTFVGFDPRNNAAETAGTTFMAPGKFTMSNGNNYVVVEPGSYMLNEAYCAKGTVADIDAAIAGAVTLTTIDGVITAKATFTFKVTAVDTINPEKSSYELTGGKLRPGKTVAVKYIDLATGTESWDKPEADTVTFKLVIK